MKVFSKEEASKYVNGLIPSIKNIDDLVAVIQDSKYSNIKESKVFLEEDLNELLRSLKLTLGALYTEDFAKLYLKLDEIPSELRVYFVENSEKKMFLGQDLYEYRLSHSLAEDISIDKVKELISEKLKGFDLDEQKIQKLIDKSLATLSLDTKSIEYLIESNVSKITNDKILKAVNDKLTEMDLQDTDKVEEARVKSIVETRLNEVIITPTDVRDEVRKEFASKGISEELLNTVKNFDNNIQEALSKITISDEQIRKACQGLNLTENQTTEVKALLNDYVKLEALTTKLEELKTTISAETDTKISDKAETLVKSEFLTTELAKYVLSTTLEEKLAAIQSGVSAEDVDSKITAKLENYVKSEFLTTELEKYISKETLETKLNDIKANLLSEEALSAYVKSEFLTTELEKYAKKSEVYTKEEVDQKVAQGGTFDASSYYQKSEVYSKEESLSKDEINTKLSTKADIVNVYNKSEVDEKIQNIHAGTDENKVNELIDAKITPLAKKSETYSKSEVDAKTAELAKKSETYNKSEVDGKIQSIQTGTNEEKVNELIDAKLNPVKTSLFTENAADAKYQTKENAFTKEKADELYLSKTTELKLKGQTSEEISDTDEIPFRTDENSPIKFVAVSKIKGQSGGDLTKPEVEKEVKSQLGAFSLGDGYAIAKALKPYLPNTLRIPDRITTKQLQNFKIKFDLFKAPDGSYGSAMSALLFSRDLVPFYPIYRTKMTSTKRSVFILSQTGKKLTKVEFDALSEVPENYVLKDNELKIELSIEGTINPYDYTTYTPDNILIGHKGTGTEYYSMSSTSETTIPYTFVLSISSKNSNYFDTMSFYNGATQGRYSDRIKVTMLNNEEEIFKKMYSDLPNNCSLETIIQLKSRDLVKALPDTEENKVIEILKEYNKQYIDEKVKANELVNKADLHNELTNNIQETISTEATKIDIVQKMNQVLAYNLKNMAIDYALIPTEKPKETTFIIKDTTRYSTSYGAGFNEIIIFDENGDRLYLTKCSPNNAKLVDFILSKNPVSTSYDTMQSSGIPESYVLEAGEYRGTIEAKYGYDYLGRFLYGNMNSSLGSYNDEFLKIKIKGLYPSKIRIVSRKDGYYFTDYTVVARNEDGQTIGIKKYSNMLVGNISEFYTPKIQKSDTITDFTTILDGENAKKAIKSNVDTAVEEKFNSIDFLSSQNLETKINDLMPKIVEKFGDNDGFKNYMKKAFEIIDEDFPEDLKQKPTDFTFTIDKCIKKSGDLPCLGSVTLTDNNGKKLYLKATSQLRDTDKRISIILTTKEEDAITGESGNFIDTDNYQLQEGEYKAYIQSSNQYRNTDYYWCFYIFNLKAANKYNYYLMKSDYGSVTVTIKDFYPKSMTIYNSANDRYLDSYRVRFFDNGTCFLNVRKTNLPYQTTSNIRIPTFE